MTTGQELRQHDSAEDAGSAKHRYLHDRTIIWSPRDASEGNLDNLEKSLAQHNLLSLFKQMPKIPATRKGQKTREHLLLAARKVIERDGYVGLRMGDVAAEAEVSLGALYRYFENKDDLFLSLIGDIHKELFEASRARKHDFRVDPFATLKESNEGYLLHYFSNRDIMRAFIEATTVDARVCDMWWWMRQRHVDRFVSALKRDYGIVEVDGISTRVIAEALASSVEQSAYVWYARADRNASLVPIETAAEVLARLWYRAIWSAAKAIPVPTAAKQIDLAQQRSNRKRTSPE